MRSLFQNLVGYLFLVSCSSTKDVPAFFTSGDSMAEDLGFKNFTPPYLAPTTVGDMLLQSVNYASSAAGIFNITGFYFGDRISFYTQISCHGRTTAAIKSRIGIHAAQKLLRKAIYAVNIGINDVQIMEAAAFALSQDMYLDRLISTLRLELETLYNLDARNIIFSNVRLVGYIPFQKGLHLVAEGSCAGKLNQLAEKYNKKLKILLEELNIDLEEANFIYADTYRMLQDITQNYVSYGFENANSECCSMDGLGGGIIPCHGWFNFCPDRSKYVYWDPFRIHCCKTSNGW